jgi:tetratricopeptide (TPR) repeat protein
VDLLRSRTFYASHPGVIISAQDVDEAMPCNRKELRFPRCELSLVLIFVAGAYQLLAAQTAAAPARASESAKTHFAAAQVAQQQGDYATAEREYKAVLATQSQFAEAHMNLGLVFQLENRVAEAMVEFRRALKIKPILTGANFFLGIDYCSMGRGTDALPYLRAAVRTDPKRPETWLWLATAEQLSGRNLAGVETLKRGLGLHPQNVDLLYLLGHAYENLGKTEVAGLEKIAPASSWSEQLLGESYATGSNWTYAVIRFQNALAIPPARPGVHVGLGEVLLRAHRLESAAREFEEEVRLAPNSVRALVRRGETRLIQGDAERSLRDWEKAITIDETQAEQVLSIREAGFGDAASEQLPDAWVEKIERFAAWFRDQRSPAAHFALAFLTSQRGSLSGAVEELTRLEGGNSPVLPGACTVGAIEADLDGQRFSNVALCISKSSANLPGSLGVPAAQALFEVGDYEASLRLLSTLPAKHAQSPAAFYWRARCYEKLATVAYLRLYQADPDSYRAHQLLGDLAALKGDDNKAIEEYRAALAPKPTVPNLHYSLGHLLWKNLQTEQARAEFEAELRINPRHTGALHDLGNTYLLEHEPEKALAYLNNALASDSGDPELHRDLGTGYSELRDYRKAEAEFKMAVAADTDGSIHYKLARAYQALGEKERAATEFALSTKMNRESHRKLEQQTERLKDIQALPEDSSAAKE